MVSYNVPAADRGLFSNVVNESSSFFLNFLKGTSKNPRAWTFTQSSGCRRSDGGSSVVKPTGPTASWADLPPSPTPATGNAPQPAEASPGSHPHHTRAHPLHSVLTVNEWRRISKKHTVNWRQSCAIESQTGWSGCTFYFIYRRYKYYSSLC